MRYDMELCDGLPMLILIACGCVQVSDIHPLGRKHRWHGVAAIDAAIVGFMSAVAAVYIVTRTYSHFTTGFTPPVGEDLSPHPGRTDPVYAVHARKLPVDQGRDEL